MEANELRIGNYIFSSETNNIQRITGLLEEQAFFDAITFDYPNYDEIEPIPLTEEWLLNFGAEKIENSNDFALDRYRFRWEVPYNYWYVTDLYFYTYITKIEFVHQLQNFYFALSNEELKLK